MRKLIFILLLISANAESQTKTGATYDKVRARDSLFTTYLKVTNGAVNGYFLKSDLSGNASWSILDSVRVAGSLAGVDTGNIVYSNRSSQTIGGTLTINDTVRTPRLIIPISNLDESTKWEFRIDGGIEDDPVLRIMAGGAELFSRNMADGILSLFDGYLSYAPGFPLMQGYISRAQTADSSRQTYIKHAMQFQTTNTTASSFSFINDPVAAGDFTAHALLKVYRKDSSLTSNTDDLFSLIAFNVSKNVSAVDNFGGAWIKTGDDSSGSKLTTAAQLPALRTQVDNIGSVTKPYSVSHENKIHVGASGGTMTQAYGTRYLVENEKSSDITMTLGSAIKIDKSWGDTTNATYSIDDSSGLSIRTRGTYYGSGLGLTGVGLLASTNTWTGQNAFRNATNDYAGDSLYVTSGVFTGNVKIATLGVGVSPPTQTAEFYGATGNPATTGTTQNGIFRITNSSHGLALDFGQQLAGSYSSWIQNGNKAALGTNYPIALNPNGGYVGIGTLSPQATLHVSGNYPMMRLQCTSDAQSQYSGIQYVDSAATIGGGFFLNGARSTGYGGASSLNLIQVKNFPLTLSTNNTVRMTITGAGATSFTGTVGVSGATVDSSVSALGYSGRGAKFTGTVTIGGDLDASATMAGHAHFTNEDLADTVTVTGASTADFYILTSEGATADPNNLTVEATATGFIVRKTGHEINASGYNWIRMK